MIRRPPRSTLFPTRRSSDLESLAIIRSEPERRERLLALIDRFRTGAARLPWRVLPSETPIQPLIIGENAEADRKSTRLNSSHQIISYAVFCLQKKKTRKRTP